MESNENKSPVMFKSGSTKLVRDLNTQHVLNLVRMKAGITAREISKTTNLQMSTALYTLKALEEKGVVRVAGFGSSSIQGGKPPVKWEIQPDFGYIFGIELLSKEIRLVVMNFASYLVFQNIVPLKFSHDLQNILLQLKEVFNNTCKTQKIDKTKMLGLGIGIPGSVDHHNGIVQFSHSFDFRSVPLRSILQEFFSFPIEIDNDANVAALGIKWLSNEEFLVPHILYVSIHQNFAGMGIGLIINHELYRGAHGAVGEVDVFLPQTTWVKLLKRAGEKFREGCGIFMEASNSQSQIPLVSEVVQLAKESDASAIFLLREVAKEISKKLVQLINVFDPSIVVIGGDICEAQGFIEPIIKERIESTVISECTKNVPLRFSPFGAYSGAMGSAALIFQKIFTDKEIK